MSLFVLAQAAAASGSADWVSILLSAGVAGVVLAYLLVKYIPEQAQRHQDLMEAVHRRHEAQEDDMRKDIKEIVYSFQGQMSSERDARLEMTKEHTSVGQNTAVVLAGLKDSVDGLKTEISANTQATRDLQAQRKRLTLNRPRMTDDELRILHGQDRDDLSVIERVQGGDG